MNLREFNFYHFTSASQIGSRNIQTLQQWEMFYDRRQCLIGFFIDAVFLIWSASNLIALRQIQMSVGNRYT